MIDRRFLDVSLIVQGVANEPAENPTIGTQYIVDEMPTGDFENAEPGQIARYDGKNWSFITPKDGNLEVINAETGRIMKFNGTEWKTKLALAKAQFVKNFTIADYFSCKSFNIEPDNMTNYAPGEIVMVYYGREDWIELDIYRADAEGTLLKINSIIPENSKFLYNGNGALVPAIYTLQIGDKSGATLRFERNYKTPEIVFCEPTQHFYKFESDKYVDLGTETPLYEVPTPEGIANIAENIYFNKYRTFIVIDDFGLNEVSDDTIYGTILIRTDQEIVQKHCNTVENWNPRVKLFPSTYASKTDGLLYEFIEDKESPFLNAVTITAKEIPDNAILFNKHYGMLYMYHSSDNSFERLSQKIYIVDDIVDYMCWEWTETTSEKVIIKEGSKRLTDTALQEYHNESWFSFDSEFVAIGKKYLTLDDFFHNKIRIFERISSDDWRSDFSYKNWLYYDLEAGDYVINKADGQIYFFDGTALSAKNGGLEAKIAENITIPFVLDVTATGTVLPEICAVGDKFLKTDDAKIYTATAINTWNAGTATVSGDKYASKTDLKVYESNGSAVFASDIPNGRMLLNKADNCIYVYDSKANTLIKTTSSVSSSSSSEVNIESAKVTETHILTQDEVREKSFNLKNEIMSGKESEVILSVCGVVQIFGVDYTASGHTIKWNGYDNSTYRYIHRLRYRSLKAGDTFIIQYTKE